MLEMGVPVAAGTDATRVASYNPFVSLYWMTTGKTVGGLSLYPGRARLTREEALRLYTQGGTWMSREEGKRGAIVRGQLADLAVLSADYFAVPDEDIKSIESVLTILGGKPVYAAGDFGPLAPAELPVMPDWSPLNLQRDARRGAASARAAESTSGFSLARWLPEPGEIFGAGCECFAF